MRRWTTSPSIPPSSAATGSYSRTLRSSFSISPVGMYGGRDLEFEVEEVRPPGQVSDRLVLAGALHQLAVTREVFLIQRPFVVGVELDARLLEDMRQEQLGGEAGGVDGFAGEEPAGPLQKSPDRPWPTCGSAHRADCR